MRDGKIEAPIEAIEYPSKRVESSLRFNQRGELQVSIRDKTRDSGRGVDLQKGGSNLHRRYGRGSLGGVDVKRVEGRVQFSARAIESFVGQIEGPAVVKRERDGWIGWYPGCRDGCC